MVKRGVIVSEDVYWALVNRKFAGQYRSIDATLRPLLGMHPGKRPQRLKKYLQEMEYMKEKMSDGDPDSGSCPGRKIGLPTELTARALIRSFFQLKRFLSEAIFGGGCPCPLR